MADKRVVGIRFFLDAIVRPEMEEKAARLGGEQLILLLKHLQKSHGVLAERQSEDTLFPTKKDDTHIDISAGAGVTSDGRLIIIPDKLDDVSINLSANIDKGIYLIYKEIETNEIESFKPILGTPVDVAVCQDTTDSANIIEVRTIGSYSDAILLAKIITGPELDTTEREIFGIKFSWDDGAKSLYEYIKFYTEWEGHAIATEFGDAEFGEWIVPTSKSYNPDPSPGVTSFTFLYTTLEGKGYKKEEGFLGLWNGCTVVLKTGIITAEQSLVADSTWGPTSLLITVLGDRTSINEVQFKYVPRPPWGFSLTDIQKAHKHIKHLIYKHGIPAVDFIFDPHKDWLKPEVAPHPVVGCVRVQDGEGFDEKGRLLELKTDDGYTDIAIPADPGFPYFVTLNYKEVLGKDSCELKATKIMPGALPVGIYIADAENNGAIVSVIDRRQLLQTYSTLWAEGLAPPVPVLSYETGIGERMWSGFVPDGRKFEEVFASSHVQDQAYILVYWGDYGSCNVIDMNKVSVSHRNWTVDRWKGQYLYLETEAYKILSNTSNTITIEKEFPFALVGKSLKYYVSPSADEYIIELQPIDWKGNPITTTDSEENEIDYRHELIAKVTDRPLTSYHIGGLKAGIRYAIKVKARKQYQGIWKESNWSDPIQVLSGWGDPPDPPVIIKIDFNIDKIELELSVNWADVIGFEIYIDYSDVSENPFLDESGEVDITKVTPNKLVSTELKSTFQFPISVAQWGRYATVLIRAFDGAGQTSDWTYSTIYLIAIKAPKPQFILVATGITEEGEYDRDTKDFREGKKTIKMLSGEEITVEKADVQGDAYIYALWGERSTKTENSQVPARGAYAGESSGGAGGTINVIMIEERPGKLVSWKPGAFVDYMIALVSEDGNESFVANILTSDVTADGIGKLTVDTDLPSKYITSGKLHYLIFPGVDLSYIVMLESITTSKIMAVSPENTIYSSALEINPEPDETIIDDQFDFTIPGSIEKMITRTECRWHGLPYGKLYRVKVATMYGHNRRTLSDYVISADVRAGIGVDTPMALGFNPSSILFSGGFYSANEIFCTFAVTGDCLKDFEYIKAVWKVADTKADAIFPEGDFFLSIYGTRTLKVEKYGHGWLANFNLLLAKNKWIYMRFKGITSEGLYSQETPGRQWKIEETIQPAAVGGGGETV